MKKSFSKLAVLFSVVTIVMGLVFAVPAFAGLQDDSVQSQHIQEADGTTGQDTNAGSGVKTGHIQNGAVTDAKISGPISPSKIQSAGLDSDTVDGKHASDFATVSHNHEGTYQKKYANVIIVAKSGGDFTDSAAAVASITDASASNPYLVKIMPGEYNTGTILPKNYVDIEGSGVEVTRLLVGWGRAVQYDAGATHTELRDLTIENKLPSGFASVKIMEASPKLSNIQLKLTPYNSTVTAVSGIQFWNGNPSLQNITVDIEAPNYPFISIRGIMGAGKLDGSGRIIMKDVTLNISASDYAVGVDVQHGNFVMSNVDVSAQGATTNKGITAGGWQSGYPLTPYVQLENSKVNATTALSVTKLASYNPSSEVFSTNTKLKGALINYYGTIKLVNCYDENYDPIPNGNY